MSILRKELEARPLAEWHEDMGNVLWWRFPIEEPPYVGSPLDCGQVVEITAATHRADKMMRIMVGGWPGYHTHWTPIVTPLLCTDEDDKAEGLAAPAVRSAESAEPQP